ncbi:unnamed protein product [Leptosia nina]|uniref:Uncharacterized protein n=1 Tax=Leptosia nina TaxID=320188 RepID=A0AAV1JQA2_9NEOP
MFRGVRCKENGHADKSYYGSSDLCISLKSELHEIKTKYMSVVEQSDKENSGNINRALNLNNLQSTRTEDTSDKWSENIPTPSFAKIAQNSRQNGLRTKLNSFCRNIEYLEADIIAITETGCNDSIMDGEIIPARYQIVRCDRTDCRKHDGAFLVAARGLQIHRVSRCELDDVTATRSSVVLVILCDKMSVKEADEPLVPVDPLMIELHYPRCTRIGRDALHN